MLFSSFLPSFFPSLLPSLDSLSLSLSLSLSYARQAIQAQQAGALGDCTLSAHAWALVADRNAFVATELVVGGSVGKAAAAAANELPMMKLVRVVGAEIEDSVHEPRAVECVFIPPENKNRHFIVVLVDKKPNKPIRDSIHSPTHPRFSSPFSFRARREADVPRLLPHIPAAGVMLPWLRVDDPLWIGEARRVTVLAVRVGIVELAALAAASLEVRSHGRGWGARASIERLIDAALVGKKKKQSHIFRLVGRRKRGEKEGKQSQLIFL